MAQPILNVGPISSALLLLLATVLISSPPLASAADSTAPPPYANHTVGGATGWFFYAATNSSASNYSSWAASQSFFLGDYLIFKTNANATVVQTYNATTYQLCSADEDDGDDTFVYSDGGSAGAGAPAVVAVPLTLEGRQYYFSDADNGVQCVRGMRFEISVLHGRGLPASLAQPPPPPYVEPSPPPGSTDTPAAGTTTTQNENFYNGAGGSHAVGPGRLLCSGLFVGLVVSALGAM